jgi:hypothetical protein
MRPDKTHVVLSTSIDGTKVVAYVDPHRTESWNQGLTGNLLRNVSDRLTVILVIGDRRKVLVPTE